MKRLMILAILSLAACKSEAHKAEDAYKLIERTKGSKAELCKQAGVVADAYLREGNDWQYTVWRNSRDITCRSAQICEDDNSC